MGEIIAVLSGKGGTGKTSFCANVGQSLCALGEKVLLVDADAGLRNLDIILGMQGQLLFTYMDVIGGAASLREASVPHPVVKNMRVLTAPGFSGGNADFSRDDMANFFDRCRSNFSFTLVDCPAGLGQDVLTLGALADRVVVVTTPDPTSLRMAQAAAQAMDAEGQQSCRIAVNRVKKRLVNKGVAMGVDQSIDTSGLPLLGVIPEDEHVFVNASRGLPLLLNSAGPAQTAYMNIARRLQGHRVRLFDAVKGF